MRKIVPVLAAFAVAFGFYQFRKSKHISVSEPIVQEIGVPAHEVTVGFKAAERAVDSVPKEPEVDWSQARFHNSDGTYNLGAIADEKIRQGELKPEERADYLSFLDMAQQHQRNQTEEVLEMNGEQ